MPRHVNINEQDQWVNFAKFKLGIITDATDYPAFALSASFNLMNNAVSTIITLTMLLSIVICSCAGWIVDEIRKKDKSD